MRLNFEIEHQRLKYNGREPIVSGSYNFLQAKFTFTDDWSDTKRFAQFIKGDYAGIFELTDENENICGVPWEVVNCKGTFTVAVFGTRKGADGKVEKIVTANSVAITVDSSGRDDYRSDYPTQDFLAELLVSVSEVDQKLVEAENDLDQARELNELTAQYKNETEVRASDVEEIAGNYALAKETLEQIDAVKNTVKADADRTAVNTETVISKVNEAITEASEASASASASLASATASAQSASNANQASTSAIQVLRDAQLIANSGNADLVSAQNAIEIVEIKNAIPKGQLFDYTTGVLDKTYLKTTGEFLTPHASAVVYYANVNGSVGNTFYINVLDLSIESSMVTNLTVFSCDNIPANGVLIKEKGNVNLQNLRGNITLNQNATYIGIMIFFDSQAHREEYAYKIASKMVMQMGGYAEKYVAFLDDIGSITPSSTDTYLKSDNYLNYFADFNNAPNNSIYTISSSALLQNAPAGAEQRNAATSMDNGRDRGVLLTYGAYRNQIGNGKVELFVSEHFENDKYIPSICFRSSYLASGTDGERWTEWGKLNPSLICQGSNCVVRHASKHNFFTDLNDAPNNSIYQLDLDCVEGDLAHDPFPGHSRVLQTVNFSNTGYFGKYQLLVGLGNNRTTKVFFRYGYQERNEEGINVPKWCEWIEINTNNAITNKGRLVDNTDINTVVTSGIYLLGGNQTYINPPPAKDAYFLSVNTLDNVTQQICEGLVGGRYKRYTIDSAITWSEWKLC